MKAKVVNKIAENKKFLNTDKNILKLRKSIFVTKLNNKNKRLNEVKDLLTRNRSFSIVKKRKMSDKDIKIMCRQISGMLKAGCDIISIFETLIESSENKSAYIVEKAIEKGKNLTESFALTNKFPKFFINMIYAGERSGEIDYVFDRLAQYYEREDKIKSKLINASIYPLILLAISFISLNIIFLIVIPDFKEAFDFETLNKSTWTKMIFKISDLLKNNFIYIYLIIAFILYIIVRSFQKNIKAKMFLDEMKFKIFKLKEINQLIISEKVARVLSILLGSGIHITEAMEITRETIGNSYAERKMKIVAKNIEKGNSLSKSFQAAGIFPQSFISMLKSGEESGNFDNSLKEISVFYGDELDKEIDRFIRLIEPVMIIIMGIIVAILMISLIYPMLGVISSIS